MTNIKLKVFIKQMEQLLFLKCLLSENTQVYSWYNQQYQVLTYICRRTKYNFALVVIRPLKHHVSSSLSKRKTNRDRKRCSFAVRVHQASFPSCKVEPVTWGALIVVLGNWAIAGGFTRHLYECLQWAVR